MINLKNAIAYDLECLPNCWTLAAVDLYSDAQCVFEISEFTDQRYSLREWLNCLHANKVPMIGFNSINYDYELMHAIWTNPFITYQELYELSQSIINHPFNAPPRKTVYQSDRFAPQIDLMRVHHFDNKAKRTSLKALEINMRSDNVVEFDHPFDQPLSKHLIDTKLIPYNIWDTKETKKFALHSMQALEFRVGLMERLEGDVMNFNDSKIGSKILEQRLGVNLCYTLEPRWPGDNNPRKHPRQTIRNRIALNDIIFPYIRFNNPEFNRVLDYMRAQVLTPDDIEDPDATIKTKGVFSDLKAHVGGIEFSFGTGGIHGSVLSQRFVATDEWLIRDIDVASLYPSIAIVNRLAPEHLGEPFVEEYARLPIERKEWQEKKGKKCVEANSLKLAGNGTYGNSNNKFSIFYDPKFTMSITINGQLMLCMLAEWLLGVPTLQIIQINTDGITYRIHKSFEPMAANICKQWSDYTLLKLEDANYSRMFIRDVNSYIAEDMDGKLKQKGAYWVPGVGEDYAKSISEAQPPAWHKDLGNAVSIRAAVAAMVQGIDPEIYIRYHIDPFDFMCRIKVNKQDELLLGGQPIQRTTRYYVARDGQPLVKISPPAKGHKVGEYKKRNGVSDTEFAAVTATLQPGEWSEKIHTKNKSRYEIRETAIEAGYKICECNDIKSFRFDNLNYDWYIGETRKLII